MIGQEPMPHYVYKHVAAGGTVLYVGCTRDLAKRTAEHRKHSSWFRWVAEVVTVATLSTRDEGWAVEASLIRYWKPPNNKRGLSGGRLTAGEILAIVASNAPPSVVPLPPNPYATLRPVTGRRAVS